MKSIIILTLSSLIMISCNKKADNSFGSTSSIEASTDISGKELFNGKGTCSACHLPDKKVIGPSIKEISDIYKEKGASITDFLRENSEPIVDPDQYAVMKENFKILRTFSDEEIKALEVYMLSY